MCYVYDVQESRCDMYDARPMVLYVKVVLCMVCVWESGCVMFKVYASWYYMKSGMTFGFSGMVVVVRVGELCVRVKVRE